MEELFYQLLKVALGSQTHLDHSPTEEEWISLYEIARKQALLGIFFAGARELQKQQQCPSQTRYVSWMGTAAHIHRRNLKVNEQCVDLQEKLKELGYRSCIVKGQTAAALYKIKNKEDKATNDLSTLRQTGDIDVWIDAPRKEIIRMVQQIAPTTKVREHHLELQLYHDITVEVHYWPAIIRHYLKNRRLQTWFETKRQEVMEKGYPTIELHAIQMMAHMYHHLFDSGIGLRQVMDYYFVLQALGEEKSNQTDASTEEIQHKLGKVIRHIGMGRFASAMMWVLEHTMSLKLELMLLPPNEADGRFLLEEIMRGGNFGKHEEHKTRNSKHYFSSFYGSIFRNFRYLRFNPFDWFWSPLWRVYYFAWRKKNGWK